MWQSLIQLGTVICNGTDAPVENINPFLNIYSAVTRRMKNGKQFYPQQCMTREQALRAYTIHGAYAGFEENLKGKLAPGMLADMIIISQDIMTVPVDDIPKTKVLYTIIDGQVVFQKN
jgi:predicted amidohydrolase YtcJ